MAVDVCKRNLRVGQNLSEILQGCRCLGANIGLAEVEEDAVLKGDGGTAALDRLEAVNLGELADLAGSRSLVGLDLLSVDLCGAITVVDDVEVRVGVDAATLAIKVVVHGSLGIAVGARAVGTDDDAFAGRRVVVGAGAIGADDNVQGVGVVGAGAVSADDNVQAGG